MKNLRAHHHLVIVSLLMLGVVSVWSWGELVFAARADTTVEVYIGPPDVCPNVPGYQTEIPAGMEKDAGGNCYTPQPPEVDLCENIGGMQTTLPENYYRTENGCFPQPTPPRDVCKNLDGTQINVPKGYHYTEQDMCVKPPQDQCTNIDGEQYLVPEDMRRTDSGVCFTPSAVFEPTSPPSNPIEEAAYVSPFDKAPTGAVEPETLINMPMWLAYWAQPLIDLVPTTLKQALREFSPNTAIAFPYYVFVVVAVSGIAFGAQSLGLFGAAGRLAARTSKTRNVVDEKYQFLTLVVHYMSEIFRGDKKVLHTQPLPSYVGSMQDDVSNQTILPVHTEPLKPEINHKKVMHSLLLWIPVFLMVGIVMIGNFLFGIVGGVELGTINLITQSISFVLLGVFFYRMLRYRHEAYHELSHQQELATYEQTRDKKMNEYIHAHTLRLSQLLNQTSNQSNTELISGMIDKLQLLSDIEVGSRSSQSFSLKSLIEELINERHHKLELRRIHLSVTVGAIRVNQHSGLFKFVLSSLLDNAISLASEGSTLVISSKSDEDTIRVSIIDSDVATVPLVVSEIQHSFDSIPRGTDRYDETGLSLFLDKIIMDYVSGDVTSQPKNHGAELTIKFPV